MQFENLEGIEFKRKAYIPDILYPTLTSQLLLTSLSILKRRNMAISSAYDTVSKEYGRYLYKVTRLYTSNNWLKMHGKPMRRGLENKKAKGLF